MGNHSEEHAERVAELLRRMGAEGEQQALTMARQLLKRARQIALEQNIPEAEAAETLLQKVMLARQGG